MARASVRASGGEGVGARAFIEREIETDPDVLAVEFGFLPHSLPPPNPAKKGFFPLKRLVFEAKKRKQERNAKKAQILVEPIFFPIGIYFR